jgi:subtilisin-like proprotein convertase family protein
MAGILSCVFLTATAFVLFFSHSVGAVGKDGKHASYSSTGAALFVSAPGGDIESYTNNVVASPGGGCFDGDVGTSFATPVVSGVVALMLQANPELSWRDVQGILATTSQKVDAEDPSWSTNGVGIPHSYLYGFGVVDAYAAVTAAKTTWENFSAEVQLLGESGTIDLAIPEFPNGPVSSSIAIAASDAFVTESVVAYFNISHSSRGDLAIVLVSPSGTESILAPGQRPENTQIDESWELMTVRNWGESAAGDWALRIVDKSAGDVSVCGDMPGWEVDGAGCIDYSREDSAVCQGGAMGPDFEEFLDSEGYTGLSDPRLLDENGVGPADACCECGGGNPAESTPDLLKSWRLEVYGQEVASAMVSDSTMAPVMVSDPTMAPTSSSSYATIVDLALAMAIGSGWLLVIG